MTRRKIAIEKIENVAARQVAFSKRRKGLFKKAVELSTLCDAEIALFVFSASGKLFDYSSTSMRQVIERRNLYSDVILAKSCQPSQEVQVEGEYFKVNKELRDKTLEVRRLNGEELQDLSLKDLRKLEDLLSTSLHRISKAKVEVYEQEINILQKKEAELTEENQRLIKEIKSMEENETLDQAQWFEHEQGQALDSSFTMRLLFP
ncbi:MADS-box protein JOINTLESS-like isoform X2 [Prosopis cineraria]|uniref:MADS-box protein JOINTLESS-like isoform X2 n=1 Tax=Prosopis cineraria TaxID=364024 RepID=UPI00240EEE64|nr:MADS-box protein JOINTLESS-like isoform X2 [Prosopis cineraria]